MDGKHKYVDLILEMAAAGLLLAMAIYIAAVWTSIPEVIPIHFDIMGNPDGYGNKAHIFILAALAVIMYIVMALCQRNPNTWNMSVKIAEDKKECAYGILKTMIIALKCEITAYFVYMTLCMVNGTGGSIGYALGFLAAVTLTMIIGFYKCKKI